MPHHDPDDDHVDALPPDMLRALRGMRGEIPPPRVPPDLDRLIISSATAQFARNRRNRVIMRWTSLAATVAIAVGGSIWTIQRMSSPQRPRTQLALRGDLDRNGRIDILDAFYLARHLHESNPQKAWDINRDGVIDQRDVDELAASAVKVGGEL